MPTVIRNAPGMDRTPTSAPPRIHSGSVFCAAIAFLTLGLAGCTSTAPFPGEAIDIDDATLPASTRIVVGDGHAYALNTTGDGWGRLRIEVEESGLLFVVPSGWDGTLWPVMMQESPEGAMFTMYTGVDAAAASKQWLASVHTSVGVQEGGDSTEVMRIQVDAGDRIDLWLVSHGLDLRIAAWIGQEGQEWSNADGHWPSWQLDDRAACSRFQMEPPTTDTSVGTTHQRTWGAEFMEDFAGVMAWLWPEGGAQGTGTWNASFAMTGTTPPATYQGDGITYHSENRDTQLFAMPTQWHAGLAGSDAKATFTAETTSARPMSAGLAAWSLAEDCSGTSSD